MYCVCPEKHCPRPLSCVFANVYGDLKQARQKSPFACVGSLSGISLTFNSLCSFIEECQIMHVPVRSGISHLS